MQDQRLFGARIVEPGHEQIIKFHFMQVVEHPGPSRGIYLISSHLARHEFNDCADRTPWRSRPSKLIVSRVRRVRFEAPGFKLPSADKKIWAMA